jgi:O-antigen/teichoic acid export membrane protein
MSTARIVVRNTLWTVLDMAFEVLVPLVTSILVARAMGPAKLGAFVYVTWVATVLSILGTLGLAAAARKYLAEYAGRRRPDLVVGLYRRVRQVQWALALAVASGGLVWAQLALPREQRVFASLLMVAVIPATLLGIDTAVHTAVERLGPNVAASIAGGVVHALAVIAALVFRWDLVGLAAAQLAGRSVDCGVRWILTLKYMPAYLEAMGSSPAAELKPAFAPGGGKEIARFCAQATVLMLLSLVVWNRSEMFFLKRYCDTHSIAYYSVAFGLSLLPGRLAGPFAKAAGVSLFATLGRDADDGRRFAELYWRYVAFIVLPASLGLAVLSGPLVRVLYGDQYVGAVAVLVVAACFSMVTPLAQPCSDLATAAGGQGSLVRWGLAAAVVTLVLDWLLVRAYGALGAAYANGLGQVAYAAGVLAAVVPRYGFRIPYDFALRLLLACFAMAMLVALFIGFVPDLVGLVLGPPVGIAAFVVALKVARVLGNQDIARLETAGRLLPGPAGRAYVGVLRWTGSD